MLLSTVTTTNSITTTDMTTLLYVLLLPFLLLYRIKLSLRNFIFFIYLLELTVKVCMLDERHQKYARVNYSIAKRKIFNATTLYMVMQARFIWLCNNVLYGYATTHYMVMQACFILTTLCNHALYGYETTLYAIYVPCVMSP